ncbi:hypothetical protein [Candidatus Mycolicibacterium alkanivorans]|uniref:Chitin-binding type-2 domain-containing protein n=1 Tax=Candidatus Mycolicibacterium alkanivorans TaxID=2954114 RepID=A0ABS9YYA6_9MYCO|nr:hypothetical protein [Candidatus Mycolicibacterium alkanivorans]MCI4676242.1 hypothetical protein [Candidatus Mycolicibacterium alkanivorans]
MSIRLVTAVAAAAALIAGAGPAPQLRAQDSCPVGQGPDDQDRWQCVHECPSGLLYDGQSGLCVAPPGVPPPTLPQTPQIPQIPQI